MPGQVARRLDHRHLHAEADAEERHACVRGRIAPPRSCLACRARRSRRAPGCRARPPAAAPCSGCSKISLSTQSSCTLHPVGDAAMRQRLGQRLIAVEQVGVFADDGDAHLAFRRAHGVDDALPARQVGLVVERQAEMAQHLAVHALGVVADRHVVDRVDVAARGSPPPAGRCRTARSCAARRRGSAGRSGTAASAAGCRRSAVPSPNAASAWSSVRRPRGCRAPASGARTSRARGRARCRAGGWLPGTAGFRCRRRCRRSRPARNRSRRCRAARSSLMASVMCGITCTVAPR